MTQGKFDELKQQLARLLRARPEAAAEVKRLAEMGDFSENAAYQLSKGRLRGINQRILEIEDHLKLAQIIPSRSESGIVQLGSTVTIEQDGGRQTFRILGPTETDPGRGIISHKSPLGALLMGRQVGDTIHRTIGGKDVVLSVREVR